MRGVKPIDFKEAVEPPPWWRWILDSAIQVYRAVSLSAAESKIMTIPIQPFTAHWISYTFVGLHDWGGTAWPIMITICWTVQRCDEPLPQLLITNG
jgi:hypothetical protein